MLNFIEQIKDPYERKARVTPGLFVLLPILIPLICVYGPKHIILTSVVGLLGTSGVIYGLANIVRGRGKALEERLVNKWGGLPTTLALRHRDAFFDSVTKKRYHLDIANKLGIAMPTYEEEAADSQKADDAYMAAARRLRELTRGDKQLLLKENIAYGFHRNMLAMKAVGLITSSCGFIYGLVIAKALVFKPLTFAAENLADPGLASGLTLAVSLVFVLAWSIYFNEDNVRRIGFVYAERLFEHLSILPLVGEKKRNSRPKKTEASPD